MSSRALPWYDGVVIVIIGGLWKKAIEKTGQSPSIFGINEAYLEIIRNGKAFVYDTISDVILHIRYTASEGGELLRSGAIANLNDCIDEAQAAGSVRLFSVRHEFPTEWARFKGLEIDTDTLVAPLTIKLREEHYPFWSCGRLEAIRRVDFFVKTEEDPVEIYDSVNENGAPAGNNDTLRPIIGRTVCRQFDGYPFTASHRQFYTLLRR